MIETDQFLADRRWSGQCRTVRSAMILSAGLGSRLRPLTDELPKPLVPIGDRPAIAHIAEHLKRFDVGRLVVNVHHRAESFRGLDLGLPTTLFEETELLGTAGGVANARASLDADNVIVWNGDIQGTIDLDRLTDARERTGALAAIAVSERARGEGTVGLSRENDVVRIRDVRAGVEERGGDFLGVYVLSGRALALLPAQGCLVGELLAPAVARGERIQAMLERESWRDIGSIASYLAANLDWLKRREQDSYIAPDIETIDVQARSSVIGRGAEIRGEGMLERVVVWPGATVTAPLSNAIVMTSGRVVRAA